MARAKTSFERKANYQPRIFLGAQAAGLLGENDNGHGGAQVGKYQHALRASAAKPKATNLADEHGDADEAHHREMLEKFQKA